AHLVEAANALAGHPLVLGPAEDGGYYLIGVAETRRELFDGIAWGGATVLEETLARARAAGIEPALMRRTYDIDTVDDLARAEKDLVTLPRDVAPHLRAWFSIAA